MRGAGASRERDRGPGFPFADALGGSLLARVGSAGAAFGLHTLLARLAGAEQYGTYSYVLAWLGIAVLVAGLGLDVSLVRYLAHYRAAAAWTLFGGIWRWSGRLTLAAACLIAGPSFLFLHLAPHGLDPALARTAGIACGVLPLAALLRLGEARLLGLKRVALAQLPDGVLRPAVMAALAGLAVGVSGRPVSGAAAMGLHLAAMAAAAAVSLALGRRAVRRLPAASGTRREAREWLRVSLPLWAEAGLRLLVGSLDIILVGALAGMGDAGIYAVASRLAQLVVFGADASQVAARPHIAASGTGAGREATRRTVTASAAWAALFAVAAAAGLAAGRSPILGLFGAEFVRGAPVLLILSAGYLVTACTALADSLMLMTGHQAATVRINAGVLALKAPLLYLGIAFGGLEGAALASAIAMVLGRLWGWTYVRRNLGLDASVLGWFRARRASRRVQATRERP